MLPVSSRPPLPWVSKCFTSNWLCWGFFKQNLLATITTSANSSKYPFLKFLYRRFPVLGRGRLEVEFGQWMKTDVCQNGSGSVCGRAKMTSKFPQECCQIIAGIASLGMRWIQHLPWEKIWENSAMAPVTALECRCPTQSLGLSTCRRLQHLFCSVDLEIIEQLWMVSDFRRERDVYFRICWGSTSSWFFQEWKLYIFISLLRKSQCWMLFEWSLNSWKKTNVF